MGWVEVGLADLAGWAMVLYTEWGGRGGGRVSRSGWLGYGTVHRMGWVEVGLVDLAGWAMVRYTEWGGWR